LARRDFFYGRLPELATCASGAFTIAATLLAELHLADTSLHRVVVTLLFSLLARGVLVAVLLVLLVQGLFRLQAPLELLVALVHAATASAVATLERAAVRVEIHARDGVVYKTTLREAYGRQP